MSILSYIFGYKETVNKTVETVDNVLTEVKEVAEKAAPLLNEVLEKAEQVAQEAEPYLNEGLKEVQPVAEESIEALENETEIDYSEIDYSEIDYNYFKLFIQEYDQYLHHNVLFSNLISNETNSTNSDAEPQTNETESQTDLPALTLTQLYSQLLELHQDYIELNDKVAQIIEAAGTCQCHEQLNQ